MLSTLFVAFSLGVTAQQRGGQRMSPEEMVKQRVEAVKKEVKLNEKQEKEVTTLFTDTQKKRTEMFQNRQGSTDRNANREQFQKLQDEENAAMKKILTEEQYKTYTAFLEKQRKEMEERMRSRGQGQGQGQGRPGGGGGPR
jgi:hypothetical protein